MRDIADIPSTISEIRKITDSELSEIFIYFLNKGNYVNDDMKKVFHEIVTRRKKNKFDETNITLIEKQLKSNTFFSKFQEFYYEFYSTDESLNRLSFNLENINNSTIDLVVDSLKFIIKLIDKNEPKLNEYKLMIINGLNKLNRNNMMDNQYHQAKIMRTKIINHFSSESENSNVSDQVNTEYMKDILAVYDVLISLYSMQSNTLGYNIFDDIFKATALRTELTMRYYGRIVTFDTKIDNVEMVNRGSDQLFKIFRYKITQAKKAMETPDKIITSDVNKIINTLVCLKKLKDKHENDIHLKYYSERDKNARSVQ